MKMILKYMLPVQSSLWHFILVPNCVYVSHLQWLTWISKFTWPKLNFQLSSKTLLQPSSILANGPVFPPGVQIRKLRDMRSSLFPSYLPHPVNLQALSLLLSKLISLDMCLHPSCHLLTVNLRHHHPSYYNRLLTGLLLPILIQLQPVLHTAGRVVFSMCKLDCPHSA